MPVRRKDGKDPVEALSELRTAETERDQLVEMLERQGLDPSDLESLEEAVSAAKDSEIIQQTLAEVGLNTDDPKLLQQQLSEVVAAKETMSQLGDENLTLKERMEYFKRLTHGRSNEMPPCWIHPETKRSEYIFDVVLASRGIAVFDRDLPHRREDKANLPIASIAFGREVTNQIFLDQTQALYRWSEENECRFFVRVFDRTGATEKLLFKSRLLTVEDHFYKYLTSDSEEPGL